ncbi:CoA pyrophosphatase [Croceicoccus sp. F390]|uniref:CoA pyrophosphatase n=1 Tax=Croceicoccus esteveae TaxID=3075597 RepID=A0ABU2ZEH9_9SPHN|nr:CoA pyrophosphatase [Croceicoccus sp. F390]MDT0575006.1 CoA pyrophosphatase [Croceicoccus sp. F390]
MNDIHGRLIAMHRRGHTRAITDLRDEADFMPDRPARAAAVLIAVTQRQDEPGILLIERPSAMRTHPGQVAFPGGAIDSGETPVQAALREAQEEIALPISQVHVIGETDRYRTGSGFAITPVLATVPPDLALRSNPAEVDEWFEVPLSFVFDPANHVSRSAMHQGRARQFIEIHWQGHRIWGVTAAIIQNLSKRLGWDEQPR